MFYAVKIILLYKKLMNFLLVYQNLKRNKIEIQKMKLRFIAKDILFLAFPRSVCLKKFTTELIITVLKTITNTRQAS